MALDRSNSQPAPDQNASASQKDTQQPVQLDYGSRTPRGRALLRPRVVGWLVVGIGLLICFVLFPSSGSHEQSPVVRCASNLRQIGLGCIMYTNANNGHWPDDF